MSQAFESKVNYLTDAIKLIDDLIRKIPTQYSKTEREELVNVFRSLNKKLVESIDKLI